MGDISESEFGAKVEIEVNLVQALRHVSLPVYMPAFVELTGAVGPYRAIY
jgi:hypothetical protein